MKMHEVLSYFFLALTIVAIVITLIQRDYTLAEVWAELSITTIIIAEFFQGMHIPIRYRRRKK